MSLHIGWYNLVRIHEALRITPAMALGVTDHVWTIGKLVTTALAAPTPAPLVPTPAGPRGMTAAQAKDEKQGSYRGPRLRVIRGGRK